jgi:DNA polymerase-3 subunit chi
MTEVRFYQLGRRPLAEALAVMLERVVERGQRALVLAASNERVETLADALWTYREHSFLPHGTVADGQPERQPIWLSTDPKNANAAQVLFLLEGVEAPPEGYELVAVIFDGADAEQLGRARRQWSGLKAAGHALTYWAEDAGGRWTKQA